MQPFRLAPIFLKLKELYDLRGCISAYNLGEMSRAGTPVHRSAAQALDIPLYYNPLAIGLS